MFERSTRGSEPTVAGQSFIRFARSALAGFERTRDEMNALEKGAAGRTRVGSMVVALPTVLAPAVVKQRAEGATVLVEEGDLTHLLPKLRLGELDLFVGRLEPGYASPDLVTEVLHAEAMVAVCAPGHPLAKRRKVVWPDLVQTACVLPPPWASLRVKLEQQFHRHGLEPPKDVIETASFLAQVTFLRARGGVAFMARSVARHFEEQGLVQVLKLTVDVDLPPVGMITLRGRPMTAVTAQLAECLRAVARKGG